MYAPNGVDPLPNVLVYVPNGPVEAFGAGVSCPAAGQLPSGSPLVGTATATDGSFTLTNVPVGGNIPLVVKLGRWRRQVVVPATAACSNTAFSTRLPRNQSEGDIPKIAIVTSATDRMECVVRATGVDDSEFTNASGSGRINLFTGDSFPGASAGDSTPTETNLMSSASTLNQYDDLLLPSQGEYPTGYTPPDASLSNLAAFVNAGGRAYLSHNQMAYLQTNSYLSLGVMWWAQQSEPQPPDFPPGTATVNSYLPEAEEFALWMQATHVTTTLGVIPFALPTPQDVFSVRSPASAWFSNSSAGSGGGVLQFVAYTPVSAANQCGRLLFDDYDIEPASYAPPPVATTFPAECKSGFLSPQEHILEYSLLELTPDQQAMLVPATADFGSEKIGLSTAAQTFTWTNNSQFPATATASVSAPDFIVVANDCANVPGNGSCEIQVVFKPTHVGTISATLTVASTGFLSTATAFLQGVGLPDLTLEAGFLAFGGIDVGRSITKTLGVSNGTNLAAEGPSLSTTGDYSATSDCGTTLAPGGTCTISITFTPTAYGLRVGTLISQTNNPVALSGNGFDFGLVASPDTGTVKAGGSLTINVVTSPLGGFVGGLSLTCTTDAPGARCSNAMINVTSAANISTQLTLSTTPTYTLPAGAGISGSAIAGCIGAVSVVLLWRRRALRWARAVGGVGVLVVLALGNGGCTNKFLVLDPSASPTPPGTYTATVTETDGFVVRSTAYTFVVVAQ